MLRTVFPTDKLCGEQAKRTTRRNNQRGKTAKYTTEHNYIYNKPVKGVIVKNIRR